MTFGELKENLGYLLAGDSAIRKDSAALTAFYKRAVEAVARNSEPLSLITADREQFKPLRELDDLYFIRQPGLPENDNDILDIDNGLVDAVLNLMASYIVRKNPDHQRKALFERAAAEIIDTYMAESLEYLQSTGFYDAVYRPEGYAPTEQRDDIPSRLDASGLLKYFQTRPATGSDTGWEYLWHKPAVDRLDAFMLTGKGTVLSRSEKALWDQFCAWTDGAEDAESSALAALDDIYQKRIRS